MSSRAYIATSTLSGLTNFDAAFDRAFVLCAYALNRALIDHMLRVGRALTGDDYEAMVIWGVLAHQNAAHLLPPGSMPSAVLNDRGRVDGAEAGLRPLRLRDLTQITRIPRETVRRKLEKLAQSEWIVSTDEGWVVSPARTEPVLREFTRDSTRRFLLVAEEMMRALREADAALAKEAAEAARSAVVPAPAAKP